MQKEKVRGDADTDWTGRREQRHVTHGLQVAQQPEDGSREQDCELHSGIQTVLVEEVHV